MRVIPGLIILCCCVGAGSAFAQGAHGVAPTENAGARDPRGATRWPQPIRVGDLIGRQLLRNAPQQTVLGRVADVRRRPDGVEVLLVDAGGLLGLGTRRVAVPAAATALLGQFVVLMDLEPEGLRALPVATDAGARLAPAETIRIGLTRN